MIKTLVAPIVSLNDVVLTLPLWTLLLGGLVVLLLGTTKVSRRTIEVITIASVILCIGILISVRSQFLPGQEIFAKMLITDPFAYGFLLLTLFAGLLSLFLSLGKLEEEGIERVPEFYTLYLFALFGACLLCLAGDITTIFLGVEIMSMSLYCLCGSALTRRSATEAALKYFLLGSVGTAFLLYGMALLYGVSGTTSLLSMAPKLVGSWNVIVGVALGLTLVGVLFKVGAVPFHFWVPDVYQGAPTPVTAFMATTAKVASVAMMLRFLWFTNGGVRNIWEGPIWFVAMISLICGSLIALRQHNVKRLLAYSSVVQAGYIVAMALLVPGMFGEYGGGAALFLFLMVYILMTLGAFAVLETVGKDVRQDGRDDVAAYHLSRFQGVGKTSPVLAGAMTIFMLALTGLPPAMSGFVSKFLMLSAILRAQYVGLAVVVTITSIIAAYYYCRVLFVMFFREPQSHLSPHKEGVAAVRVMRPVSLGNWIVIAVCLIGSVAIGVFPNSFYSFAAIISSTFG